MPPPTWQFLPEASLTSSINPETKAEVWRSFATTKTHAEKFSRKHWEVGPRVGSSWREVSVFWKRSTWLTVEQLYKADLARVLSLCAHLPTAMHTFLHMYYSFTLLLLSFSEGRACLRACVQVDGRWSWEGAWATWRVGMHHHRNQTGSCWDHLQSTLKVYKK